MYGDWRFGNTCEQSLHLRLALHTKRHSIGGRHIWGQNWQASQFWAYFGQICEEYFWAGFILSAAVSSETQRLPRSPKVGGDIVLFLLMFDCGECML